MKKATRWAACCCALALVFSLAACQEEPSSDPSNTAEAAAYESEHTQAGQPDDAADAPSEANSGEPDSEEKPNSPAETDSKGQASTGPATTAASGKTLNQAEVLALYRAGVKQTQNLRRVKYSRQLTYGKLWSPGNFDGAQFDLVEDREKAGPIFNGTDTAPKAAGLPALQEAFVESASSQANGSKRVLTIRLKAASGDKSISSGAGGYLDPVNFEQVGSMAKAYGKAMFPLANIKTNAIQTTLSAGTYTVTLAADGKIEKASLSYQQTVKGDMKLSIPSYEIKCDVRFQMTMDYAS